MALPVIALSYFRTIKYTYFRPISFKNKSPTWITLRNMIVVMQKLAKSTGVSLILNEGNQIGPSTGNVNFITKRKFFNV